MIEETAFITNPDAKVFWESVTNVTKQMQENGYTVQVQYHPINDSTGQIVYTAFIIGRDN